MGIEKVIFVVYQPLTGKFAKDYFIPELQDAGFLVEYWDLTPAFFGNLTAVDGLNSGYVRKFDTQAGLVPLLKENGRKAIYIISITYEHRAYHLMRLLSREGALLGFFARGMLPYPSVRETVSARMLKRLKAAISPSKTQKYLGNLWALTMKKGGSVKPYDLMFTAGSEGYRTVGLGADIDLRRSKVVDISSIDYEQARDFYGVQRLIDDPYYVFLDEYLPFHPDFKIFSLGTVEPGKYFSALNHFFDEMEAVTGVPVIIAAHPKSDYKVNPFGGRKVIKSRTGELVRHSKMVIAHSSTAISFAVIFEVPLVLIYESEMLRIYKDSHIPLIESFGAELNVPVYNISQDWKIPPQGFQVHKDAYQGYKYRYLTSPDAENKSASGTVIEEFRRIAL